MSSESLDTLLVKLTNGEESAAERVFRDYEPFLRAMVRRRLTPPLRAKFDSMDVVQSVWADVLEGYREGGWRFTDRDHLRAFLARVTYKPINHLELQTTLALLLKGNSSAFIQPEASYELGSHTKIKAGFDILEGPDDTFFGAFTREDRFWMSLKLSF